MGVSQLLTRRSIGQREHKKQWDGRERASGTKPQLDENEVSSDARKGRGTPRHHMGAVAETTDSEVVWRWGRGERGQIKRNNHLLDNKFCGWVEQKKPACGLR